MSKKNCQPASIRRCTGLQVRRTALASAVALAIGAPVYATNDADVEKLERQVEILMQEVERLKAEQTQQQDDLEKQKQQQQKIEKQAAEIQKAVAPAQAVTGGDHPGSFKLPGTDTSVKIGGYVKGDFFYDANADLGDSFNPSAIPADGTNVEEGSFRAHARQSRVNLSTWTPSRIGEIKTYVEGDFFGTGGNELFSNSTSFRLRHAYGEVRGTRWDFLFGQTWTLFMPLSSYPDTVDFFGPTGIPFIRQGQVRFTYKGMENTTVAFSAENSELSARDAAGNDIRSEAGDLEFGIDTLPDFVGAVEYNQGGWHLKGSGLLRFLETDTAGGAPKSDDEVAWGAFVGAVMPIAMGHKSQDSLAVNFTYGDGIGRYLINGFAQDAFIDAAGNLNTIEHWGVAAAFTHHWSDSLYSNVVYGLEQFEDTFAATDTDALQTVHVNFWWQPAANARFGVEWIYGERAFQDDSLDNDAQRIHFGAQYFF